LKAVLAPTAFAPIRGRGALFFCNYFQRLRPMDCPKHILIVEDEQEVRSLLSRPLKNPPQRG
jgi:hypothetical protein